MSCYAETIQSVWKNDYQQIRYRVKKTNSREFQKSTPRVFPSLFRDWRVSVIVQNHPPTSLDQPLLFLFHLLLPIMMALPGFKESNLPLTIEVGHRHLLPMEMRLRHLIRRFDHHAYTAQNVYDYRLFFSQVTI